jgi:hypothetical protein
MGHRIVLYSTDAARSTDGGTVSTGTCVVRRTFSVTDPSWGALLHHNRSRATRGGDRQAAESPDVFSHFVRSKGWKDGVVR